jgi:single-stranded-DNA-specific exonuclease
MIPSSTITKITEEKLSPAQIAEEFNLPLSLAQVLCARGYDTSAKAHSFLDPGLDDLENPERYPAMAMAASRLMQAVRKEETIVIYADRDVDGLTGMAILARSLRTLGAHVVWGSPLRGRGVEHAVLETLAAHKPGICIFVDCGSSDESELAWLRAQGIDLMVVDHHRVSEERFKSSEGIYWIHSSAGKDSQEAPAGSVMAFKLAQTLWFSFLGSEDPARLDYFLFDHLDLLALGILADRMPVTGENRIFLRHGLQRLAASRKTGLSALTRFFRLSPRPRPITVHEATWRLIPMLNAGGRLGKPELTATLLTTEDILSARQCIDELIKLNSLRRDAQARSLEVFEKAVLEQCFVDQDPVLVAIACGLEPSVTGLAAQAIARKYNRPAFLFVRQGNLAVGSARGTNDADLYSWIEKHRDCVVKFGGHQGAAGLTINADVFETLKDRLLLEAFRVEAWKLPDDIEPEAEITLEQLDESWWRELQRLEPFGPGNPCPCFLVQNVHEIVPLSKRKAAKAAEDKLASPLAVWLKSGGIQLLAELDMPEMGGDSVLTLGPGSWSVVGYPVAGRKNEPPFKWVVQKAWRTND